MRPRLLGPAAALVLLAACSSGGSATTVPTTPVTIASPATASTIPALVECPEIPYQVTTLPTRVIGEAADLSAIELDEFTAIGGTRSVFWVGEDGVLRIALVRGTLPPEEWPGDKGQITIAGTEAVVGPFADGRWVAAWFEGEGDRCDLYSMVFYPPIEPAEVETTLRSMTRSG
jgi:hypothetical protein